jgi:membrane-bound lytic murein transglycosylase A
MAAVISTPAGRGLALLTAVLLAACASQPLPRPGAQAPAPVTAPAPPDLPQPPPPPQRARDAAIAAASLPDLPGADAALAAFRTACPVLIRREDASGLTVPTDWQGACAAAAAAPDATAFFRDQFSAISVAGGDGFATGYFEPEIAASLTRQPGYDVPLYRRPPDLIDVPLGDFAPSLKGRTVRGRVQGNRLVPYATRGEIGAGALNGRGLELAWAADPFEAFFLEIQGSGRLRLPDGRVLRIGYDGQNGRDYQAIGRVLVARGALERGRAGMAEIIAWLRAHPADAPAVLNSNASKVFFRLTGNEGPLGALGLPVIANVSVAADPAFVPLGAPLLVETRRTLDGAAIAALMLALDTGGAIKGPNRIDLFMGAGPAARDAAGRQSAPARVTLLLPRTAAARLLP